MPPALLQEVTRLALICDPLDVREKAIDLFSSAPSGVECPEQFETATFFGWLTTEVRQATGGKATIDQDPRTLMMQWLPATDPLRIAEAPECGYGRPFGFVN